MGWQTLSLPIMSETFNGLANSDLPIMSETFEKIVCLTAFAESEFGNPFQCCAWVVSFLTPSFVKNGIR